VAAANRKWVAPGLILQVRRQTQTEQSDSTASAVLQPVRVGFTASKRVGNAVARNRAKRRLRAVAEQVLTGEVEAGNDFVLIARVATVDRDYQALVGDLVAGLKKLKLYRQKGA
jgi:ribonuclease P protein component